MLTRKIEWLADFFYKIAYWVTATLLVMIILTTLTQIFFRYVLERPLSWPEETSLIFFPWVVFLGASMPLKERGHVAIRFVVDLLPMQLRRIAIVVIDLLVAFFAGYLVVFGWKLSIFVGAEQATTFWNVPYFYLYLSICVGGAFLLIQGILLLALDVANHFGPREK